MGGNSGNFTFLEANNPQLAKLGRLAERYFADDPPTSLVKLRQFAEITAKEVAARQALLPDGRASFDDILRTLRMRSIVQREIADLFYHLKRAGNDAAHEDKGTASDALTALKIARAIGGWFHQTYGGAPTFRLGPFVPPTPPTDASAALSQEISELRQTVTASADAESKARMSLQEAEVARRALEGKAEAEATERAFWESYAADTEAALRSAERSLAELQANAAAAPAQQLELLAQSAARSAETIDIDESTTRVLIDEQLRAAGWKVDSTALRHGNGIRPGSDEAIAIAEWPTHSGPADYALFVDGRCLGVIEAKRQIKDVPGRMGQAKRYARDIILSTDERSSDGPWTDASDQFRVPFVFVTNGRPYVKQLATKSGTWFWDAKSKDPPRALAEWFSPRDLTERLEQDLGEDVMGLAERELGVTGLRPYQQHAILAVENAIAERQNHILLAMATGTGKTRLAIALMYELLRTKRFRRILFLVDRNALGRQTLDAMILDINSKRFAEVLWKTRYFTLVMPETCRTCP